MSADNQPKTRIRCGRLTEFLRRDLFTVELDDGITITAVMPEEFFPIYDPNTPLTRYNWISVDVERREPPALPKIVAARRTAFLWTGY
jgi:hypothetical protein